MKDQALTDDMDEEVGEGDGDIEVEGSSSVTENNVTSSAIGSVCPICSIPLVGFDNNKVNDHVDICLSRDAILASQRAAR
jgi:hypothetical protein